MAILNCKRGSVTRDAREASDCAVMWAKGQAGTNTYLAMCTGRGIQVYGNTGGHGSTKLPKASKGEYYVESRFDVRPNDAGAHRVVVLVDNTGAALAKYQTLNHYQTFCEFV